MSEAFQADAFQNDAFQVSDTPPPPTNVGGGLCIGQALGFSASIDFGRGIGDDTLYVPPQE